MATRSVIAKYFAETGSVVGSYCHSDGYIEYNGKMLMEYYNSDELAHELAEIGYISSILENFEETKEDARNVDIPSIWESVSEFLENAAETHGAEFLYLWDGEAWFVAQLNEADKRFEALENFVKLKFS